MMNLNFKTFSPTQCVIAQDVRKTPLAVPYIHFRLLQLLFDNDFNRRFTIYFRFENDC